MGRATTPTSPYYRETERMDEDSVIHSRRSLTLRFDIPNSRTRGFWDALKEGRFVTTRCSKCGNLSFPPQADCPKCMGSEFTWVPLSKEATLVTFTRVHVPPASFAGSEPYTIAIGEVREGVKVLAWLENAGPEEPKPGMEVKIEARGAADGTPYYVFVKV